MSENTVSGLSYNNGSEFMHVMQKSGLNTERAQKVVEGSSRKLASQLIQCIDRGGLKVPMSHEEFEAAGIMGKQRVITRWEAMEIWRHSISKEYKIPYSEETLRRCAMENAKGDAEWYLGYIHHFSVTDLYQLEILKFSIGRFETSQVLQHDPHHPKPGYILLNMRLNFEGQTFSQQEHAIGHMQYHERAWIEMVAELARGICKTTGLAFPTVGNRITSVTHCGYSWANTKFPSYMRVEQDGSVEDEYADYFQHANICFKLYYGDPENHPKRYGVVLYRKPDDPSTWIGTKSITTTRLPAKKR